MITARKTKGCWELLLALFCCPAFACNLTGTNRQPTSPCQSIYPIQVGELWGYIDSSGCLVCPPQFVTATAPHEGRAAVAMRDADKAPARNADDKLWGYVDLCGNLVIQPQFTFASEFQEGLADVWLTTDEIAYIDPTGSVRIRLRCNHAEPFSEGLAAVQVGEKWGYIDRTGRWAIRPQFDGARPFGQSRAAVQQNQQQGYIDRTGAFLVPPAFYEVAEAYSEGLAAVSRDEKFGYIDEAGKLVIDCRFDPPPGCSLTDLAFHQGLAAVADGEECYYIDRTGKAVITNPKFKLVHPFVSTCALVVVEVGDSQNGEFKYGYIDTSGRFVIEPRFDEASDFVEGWAWVSVNGRRTFINPQGEFLVKPQFDETWDFHDGLARVRIEEQTGYLDRSGRIVWGLERYRGWEDITQIVLQREGPPSYTATLSSTGAVTVENDPHDAYALRGTPFFDPTNPRGTIGRGHLDRSFGGFDPLAKAIYALGFNTWAASYKPRRLVGGMIGQFTLTVMTKSTSKSVSFHDLPDCGPPELHALVGYIEAVIVRQKMIDILWDRS